MTMPSASSRPASEQTPLRAPSPAAAQPAARGKRPIEPFVWLGFSTGGMVAAVVLPVAAFLFGIAIPLGWLSPDFGHLSAVITNPLTIILMIIGFLLLIISSAHRLRYLLYDGLKIKRRALVSALCYGGAVVASILTLVLLILAAV